ncbi:MAG: GtrA family protein [Massiliimalia sp.]|jgi:putative flippase GtrA
MWTTLKSWFNRYREAILYLVFGGLTTAVNFISYLCLTRLFWMTEIPATALAWFLSVIFAYFTNKIWVFQSRDWGWSVVVREGISFLGCRLFSGILDIGIMYVFVTLLHGNDIFVKLVSNVIVIILNYLFSKLWIFKKAK